MSTKTALITAVDLPIGGTAGKVTKVRHKASNDTLINEVYPTKVADSQATETYTTKGGTSINYGLSMTKSGRTNICHLSFTNTTGLAIPALSTIFTFKVNEFKGDTSYYLGTNVDYTPASIVRNLSPILPGQTVYGTVIINTDT